MTIEQIKTFPSYEALKHNGLTDENIVQYYSLPKGQRGAFFNSFKGEQATPTMKRPTVGTQKCTKVDIDSVRDMALEHMDKTYTYRGKSFCPSKEGWKFAFNDRKRALGLCSYRKRTIYLSTFFIEQGSREMKMWVNTMVHEIAHAFSFEGFGERGHGRLWKDMFISFGGNGERSSGDAQFEDLIENPISKYTLVCDNCGRQSPSHRAKKRASACGDCCKKYNGGRYSDKYKLRQIQNY
jgi:ribosomal protein L37AE/L43A